ncbi:MAG: GAF domain-containing protein [Oscillatoriales cyanobacterium SM2_1_8]|nr:GAF domain-containing protein [Oscillatoriales cyanobacterium SM2_1_8]
MWGRSGGKNGLAAVGGGHFRVDAGGVVCAGISGGDPSGVGGGNRNLGGQPVQFVAGAAGGERSPDLCGLYNAQTQTCERGGELLARDFPIYFAAMQRERFLAAADAWADPRTAEFSESYLRPNRVHAMLDVAVWHRGVWRGVICAEMVEAQRVWQPEEQTFAAEIADFCSLLLEIRDRQEAERRLRASEASNRALIQAMPDLLLRVNWEGAYLAEPLGRDRLRRSPMGSERLWDARCSTRCHRSGQLASWRPFAGPSSPGRCKPTSNAWMLAVRRCTKKSGSPPSAATRRWYGCGTSPSARRWKTRCSRPWTSPWGSTPFVQSGGGLLVVECPGLR